MCVHVLELNRTLNTELKPLSLYHKAPAAPSLSLLLPLPLPLPSLSLAPSPPPSLSLPPPPAPSTRTIFQEDLVFINIKYMV